MHHEERAIKLLKSLADEPPCDHATKCEYDGFLKEMHIENKHGYIANYWLQEVVVDDWLEAYM